MINLDNILKGKVVIIGIGNIMKGDDGVGPTFIKMIEDINDYICIDGGTAPENYAGKIVKENPDTVLLVDAVELDKEPGNYEILEENDILDTGFTTHDISPKLFMDFIRQGCDADIYMLAVQPESMKVGKPLSKEVEKSLDCLVEQFRD